MVYYFSAEILHRFESPTLEECAQYLSSLEEISLDLETTGLHPWYNKPILIGLGDKTNQYIFDCRTVDKSALVELFTSIKDKLFIAHNAKFDRGMLAIFLRVLLDNIFCTMVCNEVLFNGLPIRNSLDACLDTHLNIKLDKSQRVSFINKPDNVAFTEGEIEYLANDVKHLPDLKAAYKPYIESFNMEFLVDLEMRFLPVLNNIELTGQNLDTKKWRQLAKDNKKKLLLLEKTLKRTLVTVRDTLLVETSVDILDRKLIDDTRTVAVQGNLFEDVNTNIAEVHAEALNINSPIQLLKVYKRAGTKMESTSDEALNNFIKTDKDHVLANFTQILLDIRKVNKAITTYGESFLNYINRATGRIHTQFTQTKTGTGRLSSGDIKDSKGKKANAFVNFQNIPRLNDYRTCFIADEGYEIVTCDLSSAEMLIAADKSKDKALVGAVVNGEDLHSKLANVCYNIVLEQLGYIPNYSYEGTTIEISSSQHKTLRTNQKTINFAILYGAGPKRIADVMNIPIEVAKKVHKGIQNEMPDLMKYQKQVQSFVRRTAYSIANTRTNRRRWFKGRMAEEWYKVAKEACNMPIQSTNADMIKEAAIFVAQYLKDKFPNGPKVQILNTVFDELVCQIPKGDVETAEEIKNIMILTANLYLEDLEMKAEYELTSSWIK